MLFFYAAQGGHVQTKVGGQSSAAQGGHVQVGGQSSAVRRSPATSPPAPRAFGRKNKKTAWGFVQVALTHGGRFFIAQRHSLTWEFPGYGPYRYTSATSTHHYAYLRLSPPCPCTRRALKRYCAVQVHDRQALQLFATFLDVRLGDSVKPLCIRSAHNLVLYTVSNWHSQWTPPRAEDQFCEACMSGASTAMILGQEKAILARRRFRAGAWVTPAQAMRGMHRLLPTDHFYFKHFHMYQEAAA